MGCVPWPKEPLAVALWRPGRRSYGISCPLIRGSVHDQGGGGEDDDDDHVDGDDDDNDDPGF